MLCKDYAACVNLRIDFSETSGSIIISLDQVVRGYIVEKPITKKLEQLSELKQNVTSIDKLSFRRFKLDNVMQG